MMAGIGRGVRSFSYAWGIRRAAVAYSLRRINPDYSGQCVRLRRTSDGVQSDFGFDGNGYLDTTAIANWAGSSSAAVVTWYDQSGNERDCTQSTNSAQPLLYNNGSFYTFFSSRVGMNFASGSSQRLSIASPTFLVGKPYSLLAVCIPQGTMTARFMIGTDPGGTNTGLQFGFSNTTTANIAQWNNDASFTVSLSADTRYLFFGIKHHQRQSSLWLNGSFISTHSNPNATHLSASTANFYIGRAGSSHFNGLIAEAVVWTWSVSAYMARRYSEEVGGYYGI